MSVTQCSYLHANPPACTDSYADAVPGFSTYNALYATVSAVIASISWFHIFFLCYHKGFLYRPAGGHPRPILDLQHKLNYLSGWITLNLVFRSIDPFGWRLRIPITVIQISYDSSAAAILTMLFLCVNSWIEIILQISARHELIRPVGHISTVMQAFVWLFYIIFTILQVNVEPVYVFRGVKFILAAIVLAVLIALMAKFGYLIYSVLRKNEKTLHDNKTSRTARAQSKSVSSRNATTDPTKEAPVLSVQKKSRVKRILNLMLLTCSANVLGVLWMLYSVYQSFSTRYSLNDFYSVPTTFTDAVVEGFFDIFHACAAMLATFYFRHRRHRASATPDDTAETSQRRDPPSTNNKDTTDKEPDTPNLNHDVDEDGIAMEEKNSNGDQMSTSTSHQLLVPNGSDRV